MLREFILQNWALMLISIAFTISLTITGFRDKPTVRRMYYRCSVGYSYKGVGKKDISEMLKESDLMMYSDKAKYYTDSGRDRRNR